jgi:hypothetical protein
MVLAWSWHDYYRVTAGSPPTGRAQCLKYGVLSAIFLTALLFTCCYAGLDDG